MAARKTHRTKRRRLMGSHNRCWLWGRHVVLETLAARRWPIVELRLADDLPPSDLDQVTALVADRDIPLATDSAARMTKLCRAGNHQGYLAKMRPFPFLSESDLLGRLPEQPALCLLDGIQDPHNFGAIIRSAEVLGMDGMIVARSRQSEVTAIVARSSAGAVNHLPLARTDDLPETAARLRDEQGFRLVAADHHAEHSAVDADWNGPVAIVVGNEAEGISSGLRVLLDDAVCIPQRGHIESLNAAVAAGILFYEIRRQRGQG